jgi:molecular chaperone GrpE (heat shock protein)
MSADQLASIGKGIVQINLRMNRVLELLERPTASDGGDRGGEREVLLDLLDALDRALDRAEPRSGWWARLFARRPADDLGLRSGIELARSRALARLRHLGIEAIDSSGSFDAELHEAIERLPVPEGARDGAIARTHRTGFVARDGGGRRVLRTAQVSVYARERALGASEP